MSMSITVGLPLRMLQSHLDMDVQKILSAVIPLPIVTQILLLALSVLPMTNALANVPLAVV
jgi:hypothetical protein